MLIDDVDWELAEAEELAEPTTFEEAAAEPFGARSLEPCPVCGGTEARPPQSREYNAKWQSVYSQMLNCECCRGVGFVDVPVDLLAFQASRPGSMERVAIMGARYRAGLTVFPEARREALQFA